jgi:hypothetical protein
MKWETTNRSYYLGRSVDELFKVICSQIPPVDARLCQQHDTYRHGALPFPTTITNTFIRWRWSGMFYALYQ